MGDFKPIETQEQFDAAIADRITRAKESTRKEYEGWISPDDLSKKTEELSGKVASLEASLNEANKNLSDSTKTAAEKDAKIKEYETASVKNRIAHELGLSYDAINFLQGEDEASIKKSAEALKALMGKGKQVPPGKSTESGGADSKDEAYKTMLKDIKGE